MAQEIYGFFNSTSEDVREYGAESFAEYFASFVHNGVHSDAEDLRVTADGSGMQVRIMPGKGWINGYMYQLISKDASDALVMPIAKADPSLDRIDRIVLQLDQNVATRAIHIKVVKGTPGKEAPVLTRKGNVYELSLALVTVRAGTGIITAADITDTRTDADVCGVMNVFRVINPKNKRTELCRFTESGTFDPAKYPTADGLYDIFLVGGGQAGGFSDSAAQGGKGGYARLLYDVPVSATTLVTIGAGGGISSGTGHTVGAAGGTTSFGTYNAPGGGQSAESGAEYVTINPYNGLAYGMHGGAAGGSKSYSMYSASNGAGALGGCAAIKGNAGGDGGEGSGGGGAANYGGSNNNYPIGGKGGIGGGGGGAAVSAYGTSWGYGNKGGDGLVIVYGFEV